MYVITQSRLDYVVLQAGVSKSETLGFLKQKDLLSPSGDSNKRKVDPEIVFRAW
jgi:hypothetical protein